MIIEFQCFGELDDEVMRTVFYCIINNCYLAISIGIIDAGNYFMNNIRGRSIILIS